MIYYNSNVKYNTIFHFQETVLLDVNNFQNSGIF